MTLRHPMPIYGALTQAKFPVVPAAVIEADAGLITQPNPTPIYDTPTPYAHL